MECYSFARILLKPDRTWRSLNSLEDDSNLNFMLHTDLRSVWSQKFKNTSLSSLDLLRRDVPVFVNIDNDEFYTNWVRTVSALVWTDNEQWYSVPERHLRTQWSRPGSATTRFRDDCLPFTKTELAQTLFYCNDGEADLANEFYKAQFAFKPVVLEQDKLIWLDDKNNRLPLIEEGHHNDTGSYGLVTKVKIARGHCLLLYKSHRVRAPNYEDFEAARKEFDVGANFSREYQQLDILRSSSLQHDRIMQSFASIVIGTKYNLFFPWAHLDLDRFLHGECLIYCDQESMTPSALMMEMLKLLEALQYLHTSIEHKGRKVVFCHHDLKPNNILVTFDGSRASTQHPLGEWKITDFGISSVESSSALKSAGQLVRTKRTITTGVASDVDHNKCPGPYQPPEAELQIANWLRSQYGSTPGDKCDIWSFGCVILSILAFAIGGQTHTELLESSADEGGVDSDGKLRKGYFYRNLTGDEYGMSPFVNNWIEGQVKRHGSWMRGIRNVVVEQMLCPIPQDRKSAGEIHDALRRFVDQAPRTNIWSSPAARSTSPQIKVIEAEPSRVPVSDQTTHRPLSSVRTQQITRKPVPNITIGQNNSAGPSGSYIEDRTGNSSATSPRRTVSESDSINYGAHLGVGNSRTPSTEQSGSDLSRSPAGSFSAGTAARLEVSTDEAVSMAADGSCILFFNGHRARVFSAVLDENNRSIFSNDACRTLGDGGSMRWSEAHVSGRFIALRRTVSWQDNRGEILIHDLTLRRSSRTAPAHPPLVLTHLVDNTHVNGMAVSTTGHTVFRFRRGISILDASGAVRDVIAPQALKQIEDGTQSIAFDATGQFLMVISSHHWLVKNIEDATPALTGLHLFAPHEHGDYDPSIIPFTNDPGFIVHDLKNMCRCVLILPHPIRPNLTQRIPPQTNADTHREDHFSLLKEPVAIAITPDNRRLVYVTIKTRYGRRTGGKYVVRSRVISTREQLPVADQERNHGAIFEQEAKQRISIAVVSLGIGTYLVLAALASGKVESLSID